MLLRQRGVFRLVVSLALYASLACHTHSAETGMALRSTDGAVRTSASSHLLSAGELKGSTGLNAFEVVRQLRPNFLRARGPLHAPRVFLDHAPFGGVSELRLIPTATIQAIRYLDARAATQRFGPGYSGGVIQVLTTTGPR